ncbi:MAG: methyltransferase [Bryobacterales bacterium]|nr:methyltransferase [Bryobacterales bacterium]
MTTPPPPRADLAEEEYTELRAALSRSGYSEEAVLARLGVTALADIFEGGFHESISATVADAFDALIQLFLLGRGVFETALNETLGPRFIEICEGQGLLRRREGAQRFFGTVSIQPSPVEGDGVWIVSDRVVPAPEAMLPSSAQLVYPTVTPSAGVFLRLLPRRDCGRFVEVCAGCGPAAALAGDFATEVTASDIEGRAVAFCRYNARLNGIPGFRATEASLYEQLEGAFDVIAAHPPFMPSDGPVEVFYGGGLDGTDLLRQLIAGLPGKLTPGGLFYAVAMIPEGDAYPVEERVRQWLGEGASSHDVFFFPLYSRSLVEVAYEASAKLGKGMDAASRYRRTLVEMGHREFHYGAIVLRRHLREGEEASIQVRRKLNERTAWRDLLWCIDWEALRKDVAQVDAMFDAPLTATPSLEVVVRHRAGTEGLEPTAFAAVTRSPFEMESQIQGWMAMLLGQADGKRSGRELFAAAKEAGFIHPETPRDEFARLLATFVSGGFLESALCPLPTSPPRAEAE